MFHSQYFIVNICFCFFSNLDKIQEGAGEKLGIFIFLVTTFVSRVIVSMFYGWELTLVMTIICPIFIIMTIVVTKVSTELQYNFVKKIVMNLLKKCSINCYNCMLNCED